MFDDQWNLILEVLLLSDNLSALFPSLKPTYRYNAEWWNKSREVARIGGHSYFVGPFETASCFYFVNTALVQYLSYFIYSLWPVSIFLQSSLFRRMSSIFLKMAYVLSKDDTLYIIGNFIQTTCDWLLAKIISCSIKSFLNKWNGKNSARILLWAISNISKIYWKIFWPAW